MDGKVLPEWKLPGREIWKNRGRHLPGRQVVWEDAYLYPNGDLIALYANHAHPLKGLGLVKMNKDSRLSGSMMGTCTTIWTSPTMEGSKC
jgi:hypothetical protein